MLVGQQIGENPAGKRDYGRAALAQENNGCCYSVKPLSALNNARNFITIDQLMFTGFIGIAE